MNEIDFYRGLNTALTNNILPSRILVYIIFMNNNCYFDLINNTDIASAWASIFNLKHPSTNMTAQQQSSYNAAFILSTRLIGDIHAP